MRYRVASISKHSGFGSSVLSILVKSKIKRNLYYEIKDRTLEERYQGATVQKVTKKVKVYGFDETKASRELLMGILRDRMDNHKGKFISPIIYNELCTLEVKKNGRIEHSATAHDDQIFSMLLALYIWYEGVDLMERYGLEKGTLYTDDDETVELGLGESYADISGNMGIDEDPLLTDPETKQILSSKTMSYDEWMHQQNEQDLQAVQELMRDPVARQSWLEYNHEEDDGSSVGMYTIPTQIFMDIDMDADPRSELQRQFDNITDLR